MISTLHSAEFPEYLPPFSVTQSVSVIVVPLVMISGVMVICRVKESHSGFLSFSDISQPTEIVFPFSTVIFAVPVNTSLFR